LVTQFPFPVTSVNFFGRFVAGGCDDPRKAVRYLRLCTPFFVRIRSLLEGLSNDRFRFLVIQGVGAAKEYTEEEKEEPTATAPANAQNQEAKPKPPLDKDTVELLHATIDAAHDFLGGPDSAIPTPFSCIKVPDVPGFATDHIDKSEQTQLAAEFIDWLLTGNRDGELLRRKSLSIEAEQDYRKTKRDLREAR